MNNWPKLAIALATLPLLSGCVAALLPLAAVGVIGKSQIDRSQARSDLVQVGAVDLNPQTKGKAIAAKEPLLDESLGGYDGQGGAFDGKAALTSAVEIQDYISQIRARHGSDIVSPYVAMTRFAIAQSLKFEAGETVSSVILHPKTSVLSVRPEMISCAGKPPAVIIDLDDQANENWAEADILYRQNGILEAITQLQAAEISIIWLTDQPTEAAMQIKAILQEAGFTKTNAPADIIDFVFLNRGGDDRKQAQRVNAAGIYCVVAAVGDQRSDFDELYDYLRNPDGAIGLEGMFGNGWFLTPPPLVSAPAGWNAQDDSAANDSIEKIEG
jgi:hypothetical protein